MTTAQPLASLLVLLAACSSPAVCGGCSGDGGLPDGLPESFRVDAEIVSIDALDPNGCTPAMADADPDGADWPLVFERMHDPTEPTFDGVSRNGDSAAACQFAGGAGADCCEPLRADGDGWVLVCRGNADPGFTSRFEFTFHADGSGEAVSTFKGGVDPDRVLCTALTSWTEIQP